MRKMIAVTVVLALLLGAVAAVAEETKAPGKANVDLDLSGYYRVRYYNFFNMGFFFDTHSNWTSYVDQRMKLDPTLTVNDSISLHMQLDLLRNVMWGDNLQYQIPALSVVRDEKDQNVLQDVRFSTFKLPRGNVFSMNMSNTTIDGVEVPAVDLTRLWADILLPFGRFKFGRQPSN